MQKISTKSKKEIIEAYKKLDKSHMTKEELEEDIYKNIQISLKQIENGEYITADEFLKEMEERYDLR